MKKDKHKHKPVDYTYEDCDLRRVIDGDTVELFVNVGLDTYRLITSRFGDIDVIELFRGSPEDRAKGKEAKEYLESILEGAELVFKTTRDSTGKYGRYIGNIYADGRDVTDLLRQNGYEKNKGN